MNGGYFDYDQYCIETMANKLEKFIKDKKRNCYIGDKAMLELKKGLYALRKAFVFACAADRLISHDFYDDTFLEQLKRDYEKLERVE